MATRFKIGSDEPKPAEAVVTRTSTSSMVKSNVEVEAEEKDESASSSSVLQRIPEDCKGYLSPLDSFSSSALSTDGRRSNLEKK